MALAASTPTQPSSADGFVCIPRAILHSDLSSTAKVVYGVLDHYIRLSAKNGHDYAWPSEKTIAREVGCALRSVSGVIKQLVRRCIIRCQRDPHSGTNRYSLRPQSEWQLKEPQAKTAPAEAKFAPPEAKIACGDTQKLHMGMRKNCVSHKEEQEVHEQEDFSNTGGVCMTTVEAAKEPTPHKTLETAVSLRPSVLGVGGAPSWLWDVLEADASGQARLWALLCEPLGKFGYLEGTSWDRQRAREMGRQWEQLLAEHKDTPLQTLVAWQHYELSDPYWASAKRAEYNPANRHRYSWGEWQRLRRPASWTPAQAQSKGRSAGIVENPATYDPTVYGAGHQRWATVPTPELLAAANAAYAAAAATQEQKRLI